MKQKNIHNTTNFSVYKQIISSQKRKNLMEIKSEYNQLNLLKRKYQVIGKGKRNIFTGSKQNINIKKTKFGSKLSIK